MFSKKAKIELMTIVPTLKKRAVVVPKLCRRTPIMRGDIIPDTFPIAAHNPKAVVLISVQ